MNQAIWRIIAITGEQQYEGGSRHLTSCNHHVHSRVTHPLALTLIIIFEMIAIIKLGYTHSID